MEYKQTSDDPVVWLSLPAVQSAKEGQTNMIALLGGHWNQGNGAGLFAANLQQLSVANRVPPWVSSGRSAKIRKETAHIPKRWIYLAKYAKKARTRKKWKNEIRRTLALYEKRQKGKLMENKINLPKTKEPAGSTGAKWEWIPEIRLINGKLVTDDGLIIPFEKEEPNNDKQP